VENACLSMWLNRLILTNYKNYEWEEFNFNPVINCFTGLNGMGKTNLLDAIYYLSMTKSYISTNDSLVSKFDTDYFRLEGHYLRLDQYEKIVAKVQPNKAKVFEVNQNPLNKLSDHIGFLPVVFIAPDDISIIMEGSELRRKFLDNTLAQTDTTYLNHLLHYNRILFQRNSFLKQMANERSTDTDLLDIYNEQLDKPATFIHKARTDFLKQFNPIFNEIYQRISNEKESVGVEYQSKLVADSLLNLLVYNKKRDLFLQRTTVGIHKDDLIFTLEGNPLKKYASQGQRKSFLLAIKLAQFTFLKNCLGIHPILLLDDIFDKLDPFRVQSLVNHLITNFSGQIFISDTHNHRIPGMLTDLGVSHLHKEIIDGKWKK
jgi:DNA replication and repair protein RecF